ncbi:HEAT repeat-containing protein 6-like isoform X2 [Watersipora subatra]|uniref:HEAT repeat-containing protein 6-like isoform X2 n=1 Tax=Watersipora subatra TaxID=2589382 RepID=UPI00355C5196
MACAANAFSSDTPERFAELVRRFCRIKNLNKDTENIDTNVLLDQFNSFRVNTDSVKDQLLTVALKGIQHVLSSTTTSHGSLLGELLAALKAYNFFGRDDPSVQIPTCLQPTHLGDDIPASLVNPSPPSRPHKKTLKKKSKSRRSKGDTRDSDEEETRALESVPWPSLSGSESDYSDTESGVVANKLQGYQARVRQHSLCALYSIVKGTMRRLVFGYWTSFLPTGSEDRAGTLAAVLQNEWSIKVKVAALAAIAAFLERSKSALLVATERESASVQPFTPFSVLVGNMIRELHVTLLALLPSESSPQTITQTLKCLATVVGNSPYQKLRPGLLSKTVKLVRPYLSNRNANIRVGALTCMGAVVTIHAPLLEVSYILLPPHRQEESADVDVLKDDSSSPGSLPSTPVPMTPTLPTPPLSFTPPHMTFTPSKHTDTSAKDDIIWLIKSCGRSILPNSSGSTSPLPIRLEALQVLSSMALGYLTMLRSSLSHLTNILVQALADRDPGVQLHAVKTSENLACAISRHFSNDAVSADDKIFSVKEALIFWDCLLAGPLVEVLQSEKHTQLRAIGCDCLSNIGARVFEALEVSKQIICLTMLLGLTADPEPLVKESAARALGVYVLFPCQRTDVSFVADAANAVITCMEETNLSVKVKSSWAMANVADALVLNMARDDFSSFAESFSDVLLVKLFSSATNACCGEEKIRYNGVRALGSLLRYTQPRTLQKRNMTDVIENSVKLLVQSLSQGVMKVRWNACYALGGLLQNDCITVPSATWLEQVLIGLCLAMKNSKNFKVRINAAQALQTVAQRSKYGPAELFSSIWKYVIEAMEMSSKTEDFANYKYISSLSHQLSRTVLHLASLMEHTDLVCLAAVLFSKEDTVKQFLNATSEPLERSSCLSHLEKLKNLPLDKSSLTVLLSLLSTLTPPDVDEEKEGEQNRTTFRPSYD